LFANPSSGTANYQSFMLGAGQRVQAQRKVQSCWQAACVNFSFASDRLIRTTGQLDVATLVSSQISSFEALGARFLVRSCRVRSN